MSKRSHKALASATVMSLILTSTLTATNVQAAATVERAGGSDRLATAQEVAKQIFGKAETVVLVNGYGYADAVSATPLAKALNAPILLTNDAEKPSADLIASLTSLEAKKVVIVGGTGVVKSALETELAKSYTVERISGLNRYATNANVAKKVLELTKATKGVVVSAAGYADALSVASIAAKQGMPVLFGNAAEVPAEVKEAAKGLALVAVGGAGVLPDSVLASVNATRIANGADRFETNLKVLDYFKEDLKDVKNIFMAAGGRPGDRNFADALVASAAAAKYGAPVVLTGYGASDTQVSAATKYVKDHMGDDTKVTIVGGEASVSKDIEKDLKGDKDSNKRAEVSSVEALNLNQFKVVFADKVDSDSAEDVSNYEVDGDQLTAYDKDKSHKDTNASAALQDDDRTVIVTLADVKDQHDDVTIKVRKGVLSEDKTKTVKEYEKDVTFKDTVEPTVKKVTVRGNSKITVEFSEAIFVKDAVDEKDAAAKLADELEVNGQSLSSFGADNEYSKVKDSLIFEDGAYVNKVEFYLTSALDNGTNKLRVPKGTKDQILCDASSFIIKEVEKEFKVDDVTTKPRVKKVTGGTDGKIYIDFDRAMDAETAIERGNFKLNNTTLASDAKISLKKDDTQIKITNVGGDIKTGANTIEITDDVKDAYGNKIDEDTRENFKAEKDDVKPKVATATSIDAETIRVRFSEDVKYNQATNKKNYELKDSTGTDISSNIDEIRAANNVKDDDTDVYDIKMKEDKSLTGKKYTLKIKNIEDTSDNVMDDRDITLNGEDDVAPKVEGIRRDGENVVIQFSEEMDSSTVRKADNYRFIDKDNKVKDIPSKTTIKLASDNKTVTLEFDSAYKDSDKIRGIIVKSSVKDLAGNNMEADCRDDKMTSDLEVKVIDSSFKMSRKSSSDVEVEIQFTAAIDKVTGSKFEFYKDGSSETMKASTATPKGDKILFRFKDGDEAKFVKEAGVDLKVKFPKEAAKNKAGQYIHADDIKLYDNLIVPELDVKEENSYVTNWGFNEADNTVTIKFDTQIDGSMASAYRDDFDFIGDKGNLDVKSAEVVNGTYIVYTIEEDTPVKGNEKITVRVNKDKVDVRTKKDRAGNEKKYEPATKDSSRKTKNANFSVKANNEYAKRLQDAKDAVAKAETSKSQVDVDAAKKLVDGLKDSDKTDLTRRLNNIEVNKNAYTVEIKQGAVVGTTIVMVKGVDATKYDVTINGEAARNAEGTFVVTVNKTLTQAEAEKLVSVSPKATTPVENYTVEVKPGAVVGTTIVMVKGVDASKTVTIDGQPARNASGTFVLTVNKTLTVEQAKALVVVK